MEVYEAIISRRTIRDYEARPVPDELIDKLLRAGMYAPSALDSRDWAFVVIRDANTLDELSGDIFYYRMIRKSPLCVLVCALPDEQRDPNKDFCFHDAACAAQNIQLAAHGFGLGVCWCGVYPRADYAMRTSKILSLPDGVIPFALLAIGYPAESHRAGERMDMKKVHYELWQG